MGKAKREAKKARKKDKTIEARERADAERARKKRRIIVLLIPVLTAAVALTFWLGLEMPSLAGATLLGGAVLWLMVELGYVGAGVPPRDRSKAGSIDYGNRR